MHFILQYEGSVQENTINVEVMRIKAVDMDLICTENWLAVYEIVSGNEAGYFSITTDNRTNEGIIMIHKVKECSFILMDRNCQQCGSMSRVNITTKAKANCISCVLSLNLQALDYEELKTLNLEVALSNKAAYNFGSGITTGTIIPKTYPVKINVINQKEGPRFQPSVKVVTISEDQSSIFINKVITTYSAIDSDTLQTATNVRYGHIVKDH